MYQRHQVLFMVCVLFSFSAQTAAATEENPLTRSYKIKKQAEFKKGVKDFFGSDDHPSQWDDVKSWKSLGTRFAAAYDGNGNFIAVYDLSYPVLLQSVRIGKIGDIHAGPSESLAAFNRAKSQMSTNGIPRSAQDAIGGLGDSTQDVINAGALPSDWWQSVPWKSQINSQPFHFQLTDLDLDQLGFDSTLTQGLRDLFQVVLGGSKDDINSISDQDILNSFDFNLTLDGGYEMKWHDPRLQGDVSRPRKILDFVDPKSELDSNLKLDAIIFGLQELAGLITVPVVSSIVSTAISRVGRYYTMTQIEHLEMLHELAIATEELSIQDPLLTQLSPSDQENLISSFEWTRMSADNFWSWIFTAPEAAWDKDQQSDLECSAESRQWLVASGQALTDLNSRFTFGVDASLAKNLYLDADVCPKADKGPTVSIHYSSPGEIAQKRLDMELIGMGVEFGSNMIPIAGFAVYEAYKLLVQNALDNAQYWEARLTQHLESRKDAESWDVEYAILENQRINPFEMSRYDMEALMLSRRQALGL